MGRRLRLLGSCLAVALAAGCGPGTSRGAPTDSLTLPLARASSTPASGATFMALVEPESGARSRARVTALPNGAALVTGGLTAKGATNQVLYFDPLTGTLQTLGRATLVDARYDHEATLLATQAPGVAQVLVTGGYDDRAQLASVELVTVDLANPSASTVTALTSLPEPRSNHQAVLVAKGVLLVGGCVPAPGRSAVASASALVYRLETHEGRVAAGQPVATASQPRVARFGHQAIRLGDDRVLVFGGKGVDPDAVSATGTTTELGAAEVFEPSVERWTTVRFEDGATPAPRTGHRLARSNAGGALIVGGPGRLVEEVRLDARDPSLGTLVRGASLARARSGAELATLEDGRIVVAGGFDPATGVAIGDAEVLAPTGQSVAAPVSIGSGRFEHGVAAVGAARVLLFGGRATRDAFGSPTSGLLLLRN